MSDYEHYERLATLETEVKTLKESVADLMRDMKSLQNRWALIVGGVIVIANLPNILQFMRHP